MRHLTSEEIIRREYSDPAQIAKYRTVGLWKSEETLVDRFFPAKGVILDIGCGAGRTTIALARKGFRVTAVDLMPEMVQAASQQARDHAVSITFHVIDVSDLALPAGSFDGALFSFNGYESIPSPERRQAALEAVCRVLKPGAYFILTARSGIAFGRRWAAWVWIAFRQIVLKPLRLANPHLQFGDMYRRGMLQRYISPFSLRRDLKRCGFTVELFNGSRNLDRGCRATFFTNFSPDPCLFYVARKVR